MPRGGSRVLSVSHSVVKSLTVVTGGEMAVTVRGSRAAAVCLCSHHHHSASAATEK